MLTVDYKRLALAPGFRILDIGCGSGRHTCAAARFKNITVIGADVSWQELLEAREKLHFQEALSECEGHWALLASDLLALPFDSEQFDVVICSEVLEHIPNQQRAAGELVRVLKPGGRLVLSVPRHWPERICWALSETYRKASGGHLRIYRAKALTALMAKAGVVTSAHHYAHSLHTPYWWLKCLAGPTRDDVGLIHLYHRFLIWDIMHKPRLTRVLDRLLNPFLGKSLVCYLYKPPRL